MIPSAVWLDQAVVGQGTQESLSALGVSMSDHMGARLVRGPALKLNCWGCWCLVIVQDCMCCGRVCMLAFMGGACVNTCVPCDMGHIVLCLHVVCIDSSLEGKWMLPAASVISRYRCLLCASHCFGIAFVTMSPPPVVTWHKPT